MPSPERRGLFCEARKYNGSKKMEDHVVLDVSAEVARIDFRD